MAWKASASFDLFICRINLNLKEKEGKRKVTFFSGMSHEMNAQHDFLLSKLIENITLQSQKSGTATISLYYSIWYY